MNTPELETGQPPVQNWHAFAAMIIANVMLAMGPWLVRLADVGPLASAFWRLMLALPLLFLAARVTRQPLPHSPRLTIILLCSGLFFALDLASWHSGIMLTKLANATLFGNIASFFFAAYGFMRAKTLPQRSQWIAIGLAAIGVGLLLGRSYDLSPRFLAGDLLCILGGLFYALYLIAIDQARSQVPSWSALALSTAGGVLPLLLFASLAGQMILPTNWTPLILLAIGSQLIGQGLMVYAIGHLPPVVVGIGLLSQPAIAAAIGWAAYDERLDSADIAGMIVIAVALVLIRSRPPTPSPAL